MKIESKHDLFLYLLLILRIRNFLTQQIEVSL